MEPTHIYMDHGASTPVRQEVIEDMLPYWTEHYGNPSSIHYYGQEASRGLENARSTIARLLNADVDEIIFTGCGSESDNLALRGVMWAAREQGRGNHFITCSIEHKAILDTARQLRDLFGFDLTILPVDEFGRVRLIDLESAIQPDTVLISIMAANNEIGTIQPIESIGHIARKHDVLFHTDAVQSIANQRWDMSFMPIDLLSIAPHKFYGPKGIGILYVRRGVSLVSSLTGGGQENGRRAGTVNVPFAVGAARALDLVMKELDSNVAHYQRLRDLLIEGVLAAHPNDCVLTGHHIERLPNHASFAFKNLSGNELLLHLDMAGISASSGSACLTGDPKPSTVLQAIGLSDDWTKGGLRLTVGRQNTMEHVEYLIQHLPLIVDRLRQLQGQFS